MNRRRAQNPTRSEYEGLRGKIGRVFVVCKEWNVPEEEYVSAA